MEEPPDEALAREFPDFPPADVPEFTKTMNARHWHNDVCPSWRTSAANGDEIEVFVNPADPASREDPSLLRFHVWRIPAGEEHSGRPDLVTDDIPTVEAYLAQARQP